MRRNGANVVMLFGCAQNQGLCFDVKVYKLCHFCRHRDIIWCCNFVYVKSNVVGFCHNNDNVICSGPNVISERL